jgi:DNA polymerase III subunit epsilon
MKAVREMRGIPDPAGTREHEVDERMVKFAAIDFETADYGRDSACALAIVRVHGRRVVARSSYLIRPPRRNFVFTYLHGISWEDVAEKPTFGQLWPDIQRDLSGVDFLVAHNASFDRSVLHHCCERVGHEPPQVAFHCTVKVARHVWGLSPANLPSCCAHLGIRLRHHDPRSDAAACARIFIAALKTGSALPPYLGARRRPSAGP